jgi:pentatricopeptide repeat protein
VGNYNLNLYVGNHILNLNVKSKDLDCAQKLFDEISERDIRTETILISGYARIGASRMVLDLFNDMRIEGLRANQFTLSSVIKCRSRVSDLRMGKGNHGWILRKWFNF